MKLISLSLDASVLDENSLLAKKTKEYGALVEKYFVLTPSKKDQIFYLSDKVTVYGVAGFSRAFKLWKIYSLAKAIAKKEKCDIVTSQDPFELGFLAFLLKKRSNIAWNCQEHGDFFSQEYWKKESILNYFRFHIGRILIQKADSIRVVSQRTKDHLVNVLGIDAKKIIKVPVLTEIKTTEPEKKEMKNDEFLFLNMGRFVKQKNLFLLLDSFAGVFKKHPEARLSLIGRGPLKKELEARIGELNIEKQVRVSDWVDNITDHLMKADAYVLSSNYEGWARVIVEAAYFNLPIIMTDVGCAGEFVKNEKSALIVAQNDKKALSEAMIRMIEDKEARLRFAREAKEAINTLPRKEKSLELYKESWRLAIELKSK